MAPCDVSARRATRRSPGSRVTSHGVTGDAPLADAETGRRLVAHWVDARRGHSGCGGVPARPAGLSIGVRNYGGIWLAMHPAWRRCSSLKYCPICSVVAPCQPGASPGHDPGAVPRRPPCVLDPRQRFLAPRGGVSPPPAGGVSEHRARAWPCPCQPGSIKSRSISRSCSARS